MVWKGRIAVLGVLSPTAHAAGQQVALGYLHSGTTCSAPQQAEPLPDLVQAAPSQLPFSSTSFGETPVALLDMQGTLALGLAPCKGEVSCQGRIRPSFSANRSPQGLARGPPASSKKRQHSLAYVRAVAE